MGKLELANATPYLIKLLEDPANEGYRCWIYEALGNLKATEATEQLISGTSWPPWYHQNAALQALFNVDPELSIDYILYALKDENIKVRQQAVILLLECSPEKALIPLKEVLDDENFEIRFFAKQAINKIESKTY